MATQSGQSRRDGTPGIASAPLTIRKSSAGSPHDEQPAIHASDLCDWDAYSNVDAEEASGAVDAVELPSID